MPRKKIDYTELFKGFEVVQVCKHKCSYAPTIEFTILKFTKHNVEFYTAYFSTLGFLLTTGFSKNNSYNNRFLLYTPNLEKLKYKLEKLSILLGVHNVSQRKVNSYTKSLKDLTNISQSLPRYSLYGSRRASTTKLSTKEFKLYSELLLENKRRINEFIQTI